jgi:hypothetical protein
MVAVAAVPAMVAAFGVSLNRVVCSTDWAPPAWPTRMDACPLTPLGAGWPEARTRSAGPRTMVARATG